MPVSACAAYCRFCFRRERVGRPPAGLSPAQLDAALGYLEAAPRLWEVILSGGDPLLLSADRLTEVLARLDRMTHLGVIRVHTRLPVQAPARLGEGHLAALSGTAKPVWLALHVNHVRELTPDVEARLSALARRGVTLVSQTVLLKGVNDDAPALEALFRRLVELRVKPYYLHHPDPAPGTGHFRPTVAHGRALMADLKGRLSGLALPTYVLDTPSGVGKWPLGPCLEIRT